MLIRFRAVRASTLREARKPEFPILSSSCRRFGSIHVGRADECDTTPTPTGDTQRNVTSWQRRCPMSTDWPCWTWLRLGSNWHRRPSAQKPASNEILTKQARRHRGRACSGGESRWSFAPDPTWRNSRSTSKRDRGLLCHAPEQSRGAPRSSCGAAHPQVPPHGAGLRPPPISSARPGPPNGRNKPASQVGRSLIDDGCAGREPRCTD